MNEFLSRIFTREEVARMFEATVENFHGKRNIDEVKIEGLQIFLNNLLILIICMHHDYSIRVQANKWLKNNNFNWYMALLLQAQHIWRAGSIYMDEIGHHRLQHKINTNYLWMERNEKTIQDWLLKHRF